ncbi:hypothetical protein PHMEG_00027113 [Phytophthora megakarya]|uniref:Uncharacterized protein n=1 Tax=Phytophthora megakarya TaxID=4795 RepID=A0A225V8P7_9STRA|nr:hypothetical protein PHMEG_00027113 [Phytophthora megakarya]
MAILPLTSAAVVFRSKPQFQGLAHVINSVSMFLDSTMDVSLLDACKFHSVKLLEHIWNSSEVFETNSAHAETKWTLRRFLRTDMHYRQYIFSKVMEDAVSRQDLEMVKWLSSRLQGCRISSEVVARACEVGAMEILQFFYDNDSRVLEERGMIGTGHSTEWGGLTMSAAIKGHRSDIVWWLHRHIPDADFDLDKAFMSALNVGNLPMAESLITLGAQAPPLNSIEFRFAVFYGHGDVLRWLVERGLLNSVIFFLPHAAGAGHFEIVQWIIDWTLQNEHRRLAVGTSLLTIHQAVTHGHLDIAKYLHEFATNSEHCVPYTGDELDIFPGEHFVSPSCRRVSYLTMVLTIRKGLFDAVQWLYEKYGSDSSTNLFTYWNSTSKPDVTTMNFAAGSGRLEELKFLHELQTSGDNRLACTKHAMDGAASYGYSSVVQWLHENRQEGCSTKAMDEAASKGKLDVVQWLHEHRTEGCTHEAMDKAAMLGHLEVIQWLHANRSEGCTKDAMDNAATNGHLDVVKWLHANRPEGCTQDAMDGAAAHGFLAVVKWLHVNRTEGCTTRAMNVAVENGHLKVVQWLHANRLEGCTTTSVDKAAAFDHFEVVLFSHYHCHIDCTEKAALETLEKNHPDMNAWVLDHYPAFRDIVVRE